jgi:hypothetical protein
MSDLMGETRDFLAQKRNNQAKTAQMVALQLCCGLDLSAVLAAEQETRAAALRRLDRLIERERLKGGRHHWSYDLNRHVALKQARDLVRATLSSRAGAGMTGPERGRTTKSGARRRRSHVE